MDNHFMARNMPKWISTRKKPASDPNKNRHWIIRNELLSKNSSRFLLVSHENGKDLWKIREYEAGGNERPSTVRSFVEGTYPIEFKFRTEGTLQGFRTLWMKSWLIPSILWIKRNLSLLEETTEPTLILRAHYPVYQRGFSVRPSFSELSYHKMSSTLVATI